MTRTGPTPVRGCGRRSRSARRSTSCGRSSPRSGCWPACSARKVPCAAPLRVLLPPNGPCCSAPRRGAVRGGRRRAQDAVRWIVTGVRRSPDADDEWTVADVPLLDEAAELLGADDSADRAMRRAAERQRREEEEYAQGVLELTGLSADGRGGRRDRRRPEPRRGPRPDHRRTCRRRPVLGLRARHRG